MKIIKINYENSNDLKKFDEFYYKIYKFAFLDENECETYDNLINYLKKSSKNYVHLLEDNERILGGMIFDYFSDINSIIIEYIAVLPEKQRNKLGTYLYNEVINQFKKTNNVKYVFAEIENPDKNKPMNYLFFWSSLKFKILDFDYYQPPLEINKKEVDTLNLIGYSFENKKTFESDLIIKVLINYAQYAFNIQNPNYNLTVLKMKNQLKNRKRIKCDDILKNN